MKAKHASELQEEPASLQSPMAAFQAHGEEADRTAKLRSFYANIPGMIYRGRPDWSTEIVQHSELVCGHSVDAFRAGTVNWLELIHPDDRQRVMEEGAALREAPCSVVQEYRILAHDGIVRWVRDHKTSVFDDEGLFVGIDGIVYDITEHKRADEALRQSEQKLASLLDALTDPMSVMDEKIDRGQFSDVVMPGMHGFEFVKRLREKRPDAKALYLSGYSREDVEQRSKTGADTRVLSKPISPQDLARAVRDALDR